jgi:hypothetical protein
MPVNPNVYAAFASEGTKLATFGELAKIKELRADEQLKREDAAMKRQAAQQAMQDEQAIRDIFQRNTGPKGPDRQAILSEAYQRVSPAGVQKLEGAFAENQKKIADATASEYKAKQERYTGLSSLLKGADATTYPLILKLVNESDPDIAQELGPDFEAAKAKIPGLVNAGISYADFYKQSQDNIQKAQNGDALNAVRNQLSLAHDQESYDDALAMADVYGIDKKLLGQIPAQWSPEVSQRFGQATMTPKDRAAAATSQADKDADNARSDATASETARHNRAMERNAADGSGAPIAVMGPDGKPVYVARNQAIGMRPASGREQGRPVVSGDANKIADYDTSLSDLQVLRKEIGTVAGSTGTAAKVGAMLPNAVTDLTGLGTTAKQKQAVIDRVKQVIGKALEGGVLRKEDESKYEKILPMIADPPAVVTSKLNGLVSAITQRRQTLLDSLADAGYDTTRYDERGGAPKPKATADPLGIR